MVTDEELEAHVSRVEYATLGVAEPEPGLGVRLEAIEESSARIHQEFARHGAVVERPPVEDEQPLAERLAEIERRLAEVERVLRDGPTACGE